MLKEVRIRNFKSIRNLSLDLQYALGRAPGGYKDKPTLSFLEENGRTLTRCVPSLGIFGPNASGKTSILQATDFLKRMVIYRYDSKFFLPNKINSNTEEIKDSEIGVTFTGLSKIFEYSITYNGEGILSEQLKIDGECSFDVQNGEILFLPTSLIGNKLDIEKEFRMRCIRSDSKKQERTLLWCLREEFPGVGKDLNCAFNFFKNQLQVFPSNDFPLGLALEMLTESCEGHSLEEKKLEAIEKVSSLLKKLDSRIETFQFRMIPVDKVVLEPFKINGQFKIHPEKDVIERVEVKTFHKADSGQLVSFDLFNEESNGTQRIISLATLFLWATITGKTVMIDELETSLHSALLTTLVGLFKEKKYNFSNAQLIFTTHNVEFLENDTLHLSEVALVDPRGFGDSHIMRLSEIAGLRNANNFRRRYIRGDFGGIPFPTL